MTRQTSLRMIIRFLQIQQLGGQIHVDTAQKLLSTELKIAREGALECGRKPKTPGRAKFAGLEPEIHFPDRGRNSFPLWRLRSLSMLGCRAGWGRCEGVYGPLQKAVLP